MTVYLCVTGTVLAYCLLAQTQNRSPVRRVVAIGCSLTWPVSVPILLLIAMVQS